MDRLDGDSGDGENGAFETDGDCDLKENCRRYSEPREGDLDNDLRISLIAELGSMWDRCLGECSSVPPASRWGENVETMVGSTLVLEALGCDVVAALVVCPR